MYKTFISLFLTMIFAMLISAPTVISILDKDVDVSMFYNIAEEENSKETVKLYELELKSHPGLNDLIGYSDHDNTFSFYLNINSQFELDNFSPPPEVSIV
ncbi:hypothetical protein BN863_33800 [Formosa agariphila KMM 3901]|uniref:Uncharacterized protein n=1 Tax=Formosa agariphila (strain DSM 15362 / KCTC 12365 / LMG 23005 / KMM 3901 / M-2Alg 35-1) TaxID=1347342 RepID=T2KQI0_FORAG|nr:hypothetical protein [Formosa agariphila]CDF81092.1 hypothetical protein BN863_33800 [Formosa agariphila KMM 3901]